MGQILTFLLNLEKYKNYRYYLKTMQEENNKNIWNQVLEQIKQNVSENEYNSWFSRLSYGYKKGNTTVLYASSKFVRDGLTPERKQIIKNAFSSCGIDTQLEFEIKKQTEQSKNTSSNVNEESLQKTNPANIVTKQLNPTLNPVYTFETFVPGDGSNFAYNACMAISKNPGSAYNPCLLYGGVGLGKTHLIQSIGNAVCSENPKAKVMYVTAENFVNDFTNAIGEKTTQQFKNKYRKVSVLLIDDIQLLEGKAGTQEELFNTFNDLYDSGRQLVFTCDRPAEELKDITDRLRSRFSRGLNIDIQPPSFETRIAIIQKKCQAQNFVLNNEVVEFIAKNISSNVRMLESCITKLQAYSKLLHQDISLETAKEQLKQIINSSNETSGIKPKTIFDAVSDYYNINIHDIKGKSRGKSIVLARHVATYLCKELTDLSTTQIAREMGLNNHTSVIYTVKKVQSMLNSSSNGLENTISKLISQIKSESKK